MDDNGQRENGRHKSEHYKSVHAQWMMPQHQMKDNHAMKLMALMAERDHAIQERNLALAEKKAALAERDMAILQRDAVLTERNNAIMERDNALSALEYTRDPNGSGYQRATRNFHHEPQQQQQQQLQHPPPQLSDSSYIHAPQTYPYSAASDGVVKVRKAKRSRKETKDQAFNPSKKSSKTPKNKLAAMAKTLVEWRGNVISDGEDLNKQAMTTKHHEWKGQDLGLNLVTFDDSTMLPPGCSCTGKLLQCYKWGNGGWQSACCTTTLSMHPLPVMPNRRHARVAGRKMSGSAFTKLLSRLAAEGYDISATLDLKNHWAKHGTNRYITIK